jgi:hypothetical protein
MKRIQSNRSFLLRICSILFVVWIISGVQQSIAEFAPDLSIGVFLIIGTFFVPGLLPQLTRYHGKLYRFLETTIRTYKTILQVPQHRFIHYPGLTDPVPTTPRKTKKNVTMLENKDMAVAYHTLRCESILSPTCNPPIPKSSTIGIIRKFFQQHGFVFTKISDTELRIHSQLPHYTEFGEIPVYIMSNTVLNRKHIQQIYTKVNSHYQHPEKKCLHGKIVFVIVTIPPEDSAYHQIYDYKVRHNCTIIPLSHLFVTKSVRRSSGDLEVEKKIRVSTGQCNLYAMSTPVADPLSCFGRSDFINQLLEAVKHQKYIGLFGLRKIGKTWVTWQFKEQLSDHIAAYINLQHLPRNCSYLYRKIIEECMRDVASKYSDIHLSELHLTRSDPPKDDNAAFTHDIVSLWKRVRTKYGDLKVILLLDQAEQLIPTDVSTNDGFVSFHEFLETIHHISQQYGFLVSIMVSTDPEILRTDKWGSQNNPGFQCYKEVFLTSLSEDGCNQLITTIGAQMGLIYTEESLSRLYYETGGHPYVTRQLCSLIAKNLRYSNSERRTSDTLEQKIVQVRDVEQAVS